LTFSNGAAVEANPFVRVEHRALPNHAAQAAHAANGVLDLEWADNCGTTCLDLSEELALLGDSRLEDCFEVGFARVRSGGDEDAENAAGCSLVRASKGGGGVR